jgi:hypothetical protein
MKNKWKQGEDVHHHHFCAGGYKRVMRQEESETCTSQMK